jgi:amino acid transporter
MSSAPDAPAQSAGRRYPQQLARTLKVAGNMTITLSVIGPAASAFAIGSVALRQQGSGAFLAFLIAAVLSGCLAVAWAELGALYPTAGGLYGIVARVLGRRAGFLALALQLVLFVIVPSAFALAAGQYVAAVWPAINPRAAALVLLAAATALAVAGIRFNAAVAAVLLALELTIILVVAVLGLANADWSAAGTLLDPRVYAPMAAPCRSARGRCWPALSWGWVPTPATAARSSSPKRPEAHATVSPARCWARLASRFSPSCWPSPPPWWVRPPRPT